MAGVRGFAWHGVGWGACVERGGIHGRRGACMAGGMLGREHVWRGGGMHGKGVCVAGYSRFT